MTAPLLTVFVTAFLNLVLITCSGLVMASAVKPGDVFQECDVCPQMVVVPAGSFILGSLEKEAGHQNNEGPQHTVTIAKPFAISKYEVTVDQFDAFIRDTDHDPGRRCWTFDAGKETPRPGRNFRDPGFKQSGSDPVTCVTWNDVEAYVSWLSGKTGQAYRLLSEAEWEYAARAGTTTPYSTGQTIMLGQANFKTSKTNDGPSETQRDKQTVPVGSYGPNAFGLHDMHGNLWEWVKDCWNNNYHGALSDGLSRDTGDCRFRVIRGGSWKSAVESLRSAARFRFAAGARYDVIGIRVARSVAY